MLHISVPRESSLASDKKTITLDAEEADRILFNLCDILEHLSADSNIYHVVEEASNLLGNALLKEQLKKE